MNIAITCKKMKRTGFYPAFIAGGFLASCLPVINTAVRPEMFTGLQQPPLWTLLDANWSMIAMLNVLLVVSGACIMYHTEFADNAIQKMHSLPVWENGMFLGKFIVMTGMSVLTLAIEAITFLFCTLFWFNYRNGLWADLIKNFECFLVLLLPAIALSLAIASAFRNMWISIGISVICVFIASMVTSANHFILQIFPFALPYQIFAGASSEIIARFLTASLWETGIIIAAEFIYLRIKKSFN